jgi:hypothetical protein
MTRTAVEPGSVGTPERREPNPITPVEHEGLCARLEAMHEHWIRGHATRPINPDGPEAATTIRTQAAELERLRAGLEEVVCWYGEAPHTFPDWKTTAQALSQMAQNVLDGHPALSTPETRALSDTPPEKNGTSREG